MKILHVVPSYKPAFIYGGPIMSVAMLCQSQFALGHSVFVFTTTANGKFELPVVEGVEHDVEGVNVTYFRRITGDHSHVSPALWRRLWGSCKDFDVVHIHSWWSPLVVFATLVCVLRGIRPVLSPRGMLSSYSFEATNSLVKRLMHAVIGRRLLKETVLHATSQLEVADCTRVIDGWHHFILPNMVKLPTGVFNHHNGELFTLVFLSRIDPKKGLELTLRALSEVNFRFRVVIAGEPDDKYLGELQVLVESLHLSQAVEWVGWKKDEDKFQLLADSDLFFLTSYNENFANVVVEALFVGTPVLISDKVGLFDYVLQKGFGWITDLSIASIRSKLNEAYGQEGKRNYIRINAPHVVKKDFSRDNLSKRYINEYQKLKDIE
ncbi:MAG: glycosyltransferase [Imperialibacter sp.]|uniref:XrtY-associated glycosyltransferase XYAG1 n=1 Tax=Imperialibacter sp. TaxID=2038411 RepID=UPI0032EF5F1D